jgi:uncharacterized 2Fe-2S/4Fe-4S cluster protein (DUF4445 family)
MSGGRTVRFEPGPGRALRDLLFDRGVEFPCGGTAQCGACRVRAVSGSVPVTPDMEAVFTREEIADGWRLGCQSEASGPVELDVAQWSIQVLDDRAHEAPIERGTGLGAVVDVGTTTLVVQLVDRSDGLVLGVESGLNPQARLGSDLMTRVRHDMAEPGTLRDLIREAVGGMIGRLARGRAVGEVVLVGNTAMHHFFCGLSVEPLAAVPFRPEHPGAMSFTAGDLGWGVNLTGLATFLPCAGGFVGSDVVAGVVATGLHEDERASVLLDLGTNGEIVTGDRRGLKCASTAAGPAFEGGGIGQGMRAGAGAIDRAWVDAKSNSLACSVIHGGEPRGLCGSGLVDAVAAALDLGWIAPSGRLTDRRKSIPLAGPVSLSQSDVRELQLAKGAVAAGLSLLLDGERPSADRVFLAGAFGNYVRAEAARRIGLLPDWVERPVPAGNAALRGARRLLLAGSKRGQVLDAVLSRMEHVELAALPTFQDAYVDAMAFP